MINTRVTKGQVIWATFFKLVTQQCCMASCDCLLPVLLALRATNFCVEKSRTSVYFLQHENLLHVEVVILATNNRNLQCNVVVQQVARKCCPYYLALNSMLGN